MSFDESQQTVAGAEPPTESLIGTHATDRCVQCGAEMASDQRYCVECGHRRGRSRFAAVAPAAVPGPAPVLAGGPVARVPVTPYPGAPPVRTINSGAALLAAIAVILLAVGVGVLIGHNKTSSAPAKVTVVGGTGGTAATAGVAGTGGPAATGGTAGAPATAAVPASGGSAASAKPTGASSPAKRKAAKATAIPKVSAAPPPKKAVAAAAKAATSVASLNNGKNKKAKIAAPTAKLGSSCSTGTAGCQGGKLTGGFFGG